MNQFVLCMAPLYQYTIERMFYDNARGRIYLAKKIYKIIFMYLLRKYSINWPEINKGNWLSPLHLLPICRNHSHKNASNKILQSLKEFFLTIYSLYVLFVQFGLNTNKTLAKPVSSLEEKKSASHYEKKNWREQLEL